VSGTARATRKPVDLVYGVDDVPPFLITVLSALQHGAILIFTLFTAVLICAAAGAPAAAVVNVLSIVLLVAGFGTVLQAIRFGPFGSGLLQPNGTQAAYLGPAIAAARIGGMPLVFGMTIVAGLSEMLISRFWRRLRPFLPPEMSGVVVMLIGMQLAAVGLRSLLVPASGAPPGTFDFTVAGVTLAVTIVLNVWTHGNLRLFCVLVGVCVGYACGLALGLVSAADIAAIDAMPLFAAPHFAELSWAFEPDLTLSFVVAGLAAAMSTSASITVLQRLNDADWVRPDVDLISSGTLTDGAVAASAGLLGTCAVGTIATNVGVMVATGVTSRRIAFAFGAIAVLFAFLPGFSAVLAVTPRPVVAGALLFSSCFTMMNGLQIITARLMDARKTIVVGLALTTALAINAHPELSADLPPGLRSIAASALVAGTLVGVLLTVIFRIGIRRTVKLEIAPDAAFAQPIADFMARSGAAWGARPDVIARAVFGLTQLADAIIEHCEPTSPIAIETRFDEFNLECEVTYAGDALEFPQRRPSNQEIIASEQGARRLAGFMLRRNADRIESDSQNGICRVHFHFDH
jgi:xanthine permease XanP